MKGRKIAEAARLQLGRLYGGLRALSDKAGPAGRSAGNAMRTFRFKAAVASVVVLVAAGLLLRAMWGWFGPVNTILYSFSFLFSMAALPLLVLFFGSATPGNGFLGKLHVILAHVAYRYPYLLDVGDRWEYAPGEKKRVWIEGQYRDIKSGFDNRSVLGWRPFGIILDKTRVGLTEQRADTKAERDRGQTADGGTVERAGYAEARPPAETGIDGTWVLDLKRVFSRGVKRIANIDLIETTEEVTQREQSQTGSFDKWRGVIAMFFGYFVGVAITYAMLGGV